jgi:hypothetical protein
MKRGEILVCNQNTLSLGSLGAGGNHPARFSLNKIEYILSFC